MKRSYLSGLGVMGRRHLIGLVTYGHEVEAFDPSKASRAAAVAEVERRGLDRARVRFVDTPTGAYAVAAFSEHADMRFRNIETFLERASAERFFLEKPLSSDPSEVDRFIELFTGHGVDPGQIGGNFTRRTWPSSRRLKELVDASAYITMTVHGGAYGFGNNGIHHLDYFLYLTGRAEAKVSYVRLSEAQIPSGRGERFRDLGGQFIVENDRGLLSSLCVPTSSAAPIVTIVGTHFSVTIDERTLDWMLVVRKAESTAPVYMCGFDYGVEASGPMDYIAMDRAIGLWAEGRIVLPDLRETLAAHRLLHKILDAGGASKPYRYT